MTDDRTLERNARSWLEEGPTRAPDRPVEAALARIQTTRQERGLAIPWRLPTMFTNRLAVAALATVLVLAVGGFALSRFTGGPGGPNPTMTPSPTSSATTSAPPSAAPSPSAAGSTITTSDAGRTLAAGTYTVDGFAVPLRVTLPANWMVSAFTENNLNLERADGSNVNLGLIVLDKIYPDPCQATDGPVPVQPGVDALVEAFSSMPGFLVSQLKDATVGGASGTSFTISNSIDVEAANCSGDTLPIGTYERDGEDIDVAMFAREQDRFWVVDVDGTRVLLAITDSPAIVAGAQPVLDSLVFGDGSPG